MAIVKSMLADIEFRLLMADKGVISPSQEIRDFGKQLVSKLKSLDPEERIDIIHNEPSGLISYIRVKTGQVIIERYHQNT
jgi:hypothetical protein